MRHNWYLEKRATDVGPVLAWFHPYKPREIVNWYDFIFAAWIFGKCD